MKSKIAKILVFAIVAIMLFGTVFSSAYESYDTYTYSIDGKPLISPAAYTPDVAVYDSAHMGLLTDGLENGGELKHATDLVTDSDGNFYIADSGTNRIIMLDRYNYEQK